MGEGAISLIPYLPWFRPEFCQDFQAKVASLISRDAKATTIPIHVIREATSIALVSFWTFLLSNLFEYSGNV